MNFYAETRAFRKALIEHALAATGGRIYVAARTLGVHPPYLYRLMKILGIPQGYGNNSGAR